MPNPNSQDIGYVYNKTETFFPSVANNFVLKNLRNEMVSKIEGYRNFEKQYESLNFNINRFFDEESNTSRYKYMQAYVAFAFRYTVGLISDGMLFAKFCDDNQGYTSSFLYDYYILNNKNKLEDYLKKEFRDWCKCMAWSLNYYIKRNGAAGKWAISLFYVGLDNFAALHNNVYGTWKDCIQTAFSKALSDRFPGPVQEMAAGGIGLVGRKAYDELIPTPDHNITNDLNDFLNDKLVGAPDISATIVGDGAGLLIDDKGTWYSMVNAGYKTFWSVAMLGGIHYLYYIAEVCNTILDYFVSMLTDACIADIGNNHYYIPNLIANFIPGEAFNHEEACVASEEAFLEQSLSYFKKRLEEIKNKFPDREITADVRQAPTHDTINVYDLPKAPPHLQNRKPIAPTRTHNGTPIINVYDLPKAPPHLQNRAPIAPPRLQSSNSSINVYDLPKAL